MAGDSPARWDGWDRSKQDRQASDGDQEPHRGPRHGPGGKWAAEPPRSGRGLVPGKSSWSRTRPRPTGSGGEDERFGWSGPVVGLGGLEPAASSLSA